jgi:hypothetical protein
MRILNAIFDIMQRRGVVVAALSAVAVAAGCQRPADLGEVANLEKAVSIREILKGEGAAAEGGAAEPVGTGWATLKGRFTFEGEPPAMPPYDVNKDHDTCAPGGNAPPQEWLVVDAASKGIANIAIYARDVARVHESAQPGQEAIDFDQKQCVFLSHVAGIPVGQPVAIKNSDPVGHNTKIDGTGFNQTIPVGGTVPWTAQRETAMPIGVHCSIHPWMISYMVVRENKYYAVTAPDGSFEIPNLPAGEEVEIQIWHESATGSQGALVITTDAAKELKWSGKGRIKIKLEENEVREIDIAVPASAFRGA